MKTLLFLLALCLPAMAQRKLWTWDSPHAGEEGFAGALHASSTDSRGYTAMVIGEIKQLWPEPVEYTRYRLLWISPTGTVLHEELVDRPGQQWHQILNVEPAEPWSVLVVSPTLFAVTDSRNIWKVALKGKAKTRSVAVVADGEIACPASSLPVFAGWLQQKGSGGSMFYNHDKEGSFYVASAISLWSLK